MYRQLDSFGSHWPITYTYRCGFRKLSRFVTTGTEMSPDIQLQVCCDVRNALHMIEDGDHVIDVVSRLEFSYVYKVCVYSIIKEYTSGQRNVLCQSSKQDQQFDNLVT